jgi:hypothetical protein
MTPFVSFCKDLLSVLEYLPVMQLIPVLHLIVGIVVLSTVLFVRARRRTQAAPKQTQDMASSAQGDLSTPSAIVALDDRVWLPATQPVADFICDAGFFVEGRLTTLGEADSGGRREFVSLAEVQPPGLPQRLPNYIVTSDIVGHMAELVAYYQRLITAASNTGLTRALQDPFPYFRIPPIIAAGAELADFPYDTVAEATMVLRGIATCPFDASEPQEILDDLEQGWRCRLAAWRGRIGLIEWNWETTAEPLTKGFSFDGAEFARQAEAALHRLADIHRELVQALCQDYWNYQPSAS